MKYKPGDKVRIKSLDWYEANKCDGLVMCDGIAFLQMMTGWCGKELTIDCIFTDERGSGYIMKEPNIHWRFTDGMIEDPVDVKPQEMMVSLEDVCNFLNDHLYTDISTGDYDYGQEYIRSDFDNATDLIFALRKALGD